MNNFVTIYDIVTINFAKQKIDSNTYYDVIYAIAKPYIQRQILEVH